MGHESGHGHGHGHDKVQLPDYRQWKVEGTPLEEVQKMLARRGLRDPWARNEVWRYHGGFARPISIPEIFTRGFKWGAIAFIIALGIEYTVFPPKKNGGHH